MAEPLLPQLRTLVDEFAKQENLPPNAAQDVEASIASSPYLASVMVDAAASQKTLKHIGVRTEKHEGGHYDKETGTIFVSVDTFTDGNAKPQARIDNITSTLGHETGHALTEKARSAEIDRLSTAIEIKLIEGLGNASKVDLTPEARRYLDFTRNDEALSELISMNSVASRIASQPGGYNEKEFLRRMDASTRRIERGENARHAELAAGIKLSDHGLQFT